MKKVALCFRGLDNYFLESWNNIKEFIIDDLRKTYIVDIFINSYKTELSEDIVNKLNPVSILYNESREGCSSMSYIVPTQIIECCELVLNYEYEHNFKYDYVIITRFDLTFNNKFNEYDINFDKINTECMFVPDYNSGDNFILFKRELLEVVYNSTKKCMSVGSNSHRLHEFFRDYGDICHYIGGETGKRNPHYDVMFRFTRYICDPNHPKR